MGDLMDKVFFYIYMFIYAASLIQIVSVPQTAGGS